jgi:hypothetical protein
MKQFFKLLKCYFLSNHPLADDFVFSAQLKLVKCVNCGGLFYRVTMTGGDFSVLPVTAHTALLVRAAFPETFSKTEIELKPKAEIIVRKDFVMSGEEFMFRLEAQSGVIEKALARRIDRGRERT